MLATNRSESKERVDKPVFCDRLNPNNARYILLTRKSSGFFLAKK